MPPEKPEKKTPLEDSPRGRLLDALLEFIQKYYPQQTPRTRQTVYVLFVLLFLYAGFRVIGGEFTLRGRVYHHDRRLAGGLDVVYEDLWAGTSSKGEYTLVLTGTGYAKAIALGVNASVFRNDKELGQFSLRAGGMTFSRLGDITLAPAGAPAAVTNLAPPRSLLPAFVVPVHAAKGDEDRLFVTSLKVGPTLRTPESVRVDCWCGGAREPLRGVAVGGRTAGRLPTATHIVEYGLDYFFPMVNGAEPDIRLDAETFLFGYDEAFPARRKLDRGESEDVKGSRGGLMKVIRLSPYDVTLLATPNTPSTVLLELQEALLEKGHRAVVGNRVEGNRQPRTLLTGADVPPAVAREIRNVINDDRPLVKTVAAQRMDQGRQEIIVDLALDPDRIVTVPASMRWVDTGIDVEEDERFIFNAQGTVRWRATGPPVGPEGASTYKHVPLIYQVQGLGPGALIGRIIGGRDFKIGATREPIAMPSRGRLQLGINDNSFSDNSGNFVVTVAATY